MLQREDFIERLSGKGYTKRDASMVMDDFILTLREALVEGESVMFRGFGTFEVRDRAGRESVSPTTGERINVPPYRAAHFTSGKTLRRELNEGTKQE